MKKNFMMIALASVLMMPVSCTKNELEAPQGPAAGELTFVAYAEGGDSKTTLNEGDGSVAWAAGDQIKFDYELEKVAGEAVLSSVLAEGDIVDGAAEFKAALPQAFTMSASDYEATLGADAKNSRHIYATYPAAIETDYSSASEFLVTVPTEQDGTFSNASIALAKWDSNKPADPLQFFNLCGLLQIEIADDAARKVVLTSSTDIAGKVSVGFSTGVPAVKTSKNAVPANEITVNVDGAGTYYVAVLPGELEDVYVAIYDEADVLLGDRTANNAIPVARKQIRKLGTIGTGFADRYYVKTTAIGKCDGSSWDNAADYATLVTKLQATNSALTVYMASGSYKTSGEAKINIANTDANIAIYGGYPENATGMGASGRDYINNPTILDAEGNSRIWVLLVGSWRVDGLTFKNALCSSKDTGSALVIEGSNGAAFTINNCTFDSNQNTGAGGGGAVRVSNATADFNNCSFTNNQSKQFGSAVFVNGTAVCNMTNCTFSGNKENVYDGAVYVNSGTTVNAVGCEFLNNTSARHAGAISVKGVLNATNCHFEGNETVQKGGAIWARAESGVKVNLDGCTFKSNASTGSTGGGAVVIEKAAEFSAADCVFDSNTAAVNGGAVLFVGLATSEAPSFTNCKFLNNTVVTETENNGLGSAAAAAGSGSGYATFESCVFDGNVAYNGGALWTRSVSYHLNNCSFVNNSSTKGGGTIFMDGSNSPVVYCNNCYFSFSDETKVSGAASPVIYAAVGKLGLNNSVMAGAWGGKATTQIKVGSSATIVNSTLHGQMGDRKVDGVDVVQANIVNNGICNIVNSIVANSASSGKGKSFYNNGNLNVCYTLYYSNSNNSNSSEDVTATISNSLEGVICHPTNRNFPDATENAWYKTNSSIMYSNNQTTTEEVSDVRGYLHYYKWAGSVPSAIGEFTKATSEQVSTAVQNADADFYNWVSASLSMDIRGNVRNTAAMWPGSYEDATATANMENLNVK